MTAANLPMITRRLFDFSDRDEGTQFYLDHVWGHFGLKGTSIPCIVGITGQAGVGKSTAAQALRHALGYAKASFATSLKSVCEMIYVPLGAEPRHFHGTQEDKAEPIPALGGTTGRKILQLVGTEGFRAAFGNTWPLLSLKMHDDFLAGGGRLVYEDVRFENEAAAIRERGGIIVHLSVLGEAPSGDKHASEAGIPESLVTTTAAAARGDVPGLQSQVLAAVLKATYDRLRAEGATTAGAGPGLN